MNILYLQYIVTINNCGSIGKAAKKLLLKQQYLSYVLKTVEKEFSIQIFHRHSKGVSLTADGAIFLDAAKQILAIYEKMHLQYQYPSKQITNQKNANLFIYSPPILFPYHINKAIAEYLDHFPYMDVNLREDDCQDVHVLTDKLLADDFSIAFFIIKESIEELQAQLSPDFVCVKLDSNKITMLTSKTTYDSDPMKEISLKDLCQKDLLFCAPGGLKSNFMYQILKRYGKPNVASVVQNNTTFLTLLESRPYYALGYDRNVAYNRNIVAVPISDYANQSPTSVVITRKDNFDSPLIRDFINLLLIQLEKPTI